MADNDNKIIQFKKPISINIGMIIFAVILIYIIVCIYGYATAKHVVPYEVKEGSLSANNIYQGIALREEEIVNATQAGYINYYAREGARVGVGNLVYTLDESGKLSEYIASENSADTILTSRDLAELRTEILGFVSVFDKNNFSTVYDFKFNVKGTVLKLANANILQNIDKINGNSVADLVSFCRAPQTGIVVYSTDGYEDLTLEQFHKDLFNTKTYEKQQLISNNFVSVGDAVYKLSKSEDWSIVIHVDEAKADELEELEYVRVKFLKNQDISWGKVRRYTNSEGDTFVELTFTNSMLAFCTDRFIDVELITEDKTGLKIPVSSIIEKEFYIIPEDYLTESGTSGAVGVIRQIYLEDGTPSTEFIETAIYNKELPLETPLPEEEERIDYDRENFGEPAGSGDASSDPTPSPGADRDTDGGDSEDTGEDTSGTDAGEGSPIEESLPASAHAEPVMNCYLDDTTLRYGDILVKPDTMETLKIDTKGTLVGVYNINKGYADFKQIHILYSNEEYAIVESNTQYGLVVYDYIALDCSSVEENEIITG